MCDTVELAASASAKSHKEKYSPMGTVATVKPRRKTTATTTLAALDRAIADKEQTTVQTQNVPTTEKRKPGRPKKVTTATVVPAETVKGSTVVETTKRKPGRPRKIVADTVVTTTATATVPNLDGITQLQHDAASVKNRATMANAASAAQDKKRKTVARKNAIKAVGNAEYSIGTVQSSKDEYAHNIRPMVIERLPLGFDVSTLSDNERARLVDSRYILPDNDRLTDWTLQARILVSVEHMAFYASLKNTDDDKTIKSLYNNVGYGMHLLPIASFVDRVANKARNAGSYENGAVELFSTYSAYCTGKSQKPNDKISVLNCRASVVSGSDQKADGYSRTMAVMGADQIGMLLTAYECPTVAQWITQKMIAIAPHVRRIGESEDRYNDRIANGDYTTPNAKDVFDTGKRDTDAKAELKRLAKARLSAAFGK